MTTPRRHGEPVLAERSAIAERLRSQGHTAGTTRMAIVDAVLAANGSFTLDELVARVDKVHAATVYRTLALLEELGALRHIHLSHGAAIYEVVSSADSSRHIVCEECGRHIEVPRELFGSVEQRLEHDHGFLLAGSHFAIVGRCVRCASSADTGHHR